MGKVLELKPKDFIFEQSDLIEYSIDTDNPVALFATGLLFYEDSDYNNDSFDAAMFYISLAAESGFCPAQIKLANILRYEIGGEQETLAAIHWLKKAASKGDSQAQLELAQVILDANDECDIEEAVKWVVMSAKGGFAEAMLALVEMYDAGLTSGVTKEECEGYIEKAAEAGIPGAMTRMGMMKVSSGNENEGIEWLIDAAEMGDDDAIAIISKNNLWRLTKEDDVQKCIDRLQYQLQSGNSQCGIILGDYYAKDPNDRSSLIKALAFYGASCVFGENEAEEKMMNINKLLCN